MLLQIDDQMEDILNKLEDESNKYKNVGSILSRLKQSGFLTQYYQFINEIFSQEHKFTVQELINIQTEYQDEFNFKEFYKMNQDIFKTNFNIISQNIINNVSENYVLMLNKQNVNQKSNRDVFNYKTQHREQQELFTTLEEKTQENISQTSSSPHYRLKTQNQEINESLTNLDQNLKQILNNHKSNSYINYHQKSQSSLHQRHQYSSIGSYSQYQYSNLKNISNGTIVNSPNKSIQFYKKIENSELQNAKGGSFDKQIRKLTETLSETKFVGPGHYQIDTKKKNGFTIGKSPKKTLFDQLQRIPDRLYNNSLHMISRPMKK